MTFATESAVVSRAIGLACVEGRERRGQALEPTTMIDVKPLIAANYTSDATMASLRRRLLPHVFDAFGVEEAIVPCSFAQAGEGPPSAADVFRRANGAWQTAPLASFEHDEENLLQVHGLDGEVFVRFSRGRFDPENLKIGISLVEDGIRRFAGRDIVRQSSLARFGQDFALVGHSEALLHLEDEIQKASKTALNTYVFGEEGTETMGTAFGLHALGRCRSRPFVVVECSCVDDIDFGRALQRAANRAQDGSILVSGIETLSGDAIERMRMVLESRSGQWIAGANDAAMCHARIIVSSGYSPRELRNRLSLPRHLVDEMATIPIRVPALRERLEDLNHHIDKALSGFAGPVQSRLGSAHRAQMARHSWPGNLAELDSTVARVVAMALAPDQIFRHDDVSADPEAAVTDGTFASCSKTPPWEELAHQIGNGIMSGIAGLHPSLQRSIVCISENYAEELTTVEIARKSFVSSSHLSHLYKEKLGVPIRTFLARVRIELAKRLLLEQAERRVTDISLQVGFGDFSHFLKSFKRAVGVTPKEYRRTSTMS